jgi:hypothetical protein
MRTTVRLDDDLLERLRAEAERENVSLTRFINRTLKAGLDARSPRTKRKAYREQPHALGEPAVSLDKALAIVSTLDDEENLRKLLLRK